VLKSLFVVLAAVAALAVPATSLGASRNVVVDVVITDHGILMGLYTNAQVADISTMTPLMGPLYTKDDVHFVVFNRSKKSQKFSVFGSTTSTIHPGGSARFEKRPPHVGRFPYKSTLASGPSFHGVLTVR